MINLILIFPIIACLILFLFKKKFLNNFMIIFYAILHFLASVFIYIDKFVFPSKFFEADNLSKIFLMVLSAVYLAFSIYNKGYMKDADKSVRKLRHYSYMILLFVFSMTGAILANNLGLAWIFIEGTTLASAYLIYFDKTKHSIEAAFKYVFICSIGIALAFVGIILLTASSGNLNSLFYKDLIENAANFNPFWLKLSFIFILFGIGTKMGLAPVHFWLPDAHAEAPSPISALLSAALLNSAFLMILNVFKIITAAGVGDYARIMMFVMGFLSLFVACVFVYHINNYKRMLAYSSIENMGILIIGAALGGSGLMASLIHLIGHSFIKASFFMTSGNVLKIYKTKKISNIKGLIEKDKKTGWLFLLSFIGITAFPPSILFISEFIMIKSMLLQKHYFMSAIFMLFLTIILFGIGRAVISMCYGKNENEIEDKKLPISMYLPQGILLVLVFVFGIYMPDSFVNLIFAAASGFLGE